MVGDHLRNLRKERKLTLRSLGEKLNVDYSYLGRIANPSMQLLKVMI